MNWQRWLQLWVRQNLNDLSAQDLSDLKDFRDQAILIAREVLSSHSSSVRYSGSAEDLAGDFLLYLRGEGKDQIRTRHILKSEMRRYLKRSCSPFEDEVWHIVVEALKDLGNANEAHRAPNIFSPSKGEFSDKDDLWSDPSKASVPRLPVESSRDLLAQTVDTIWAEIAQTHLQTQKESSNGNLIAPRRKVMTPTIAKELLLGTLRELGGPVSLGELNAQVCRVLGGFRIQTEEAPSSQEGAGDETSVSVIDEHSGDGLPESTYQFLQMESKKRGKELGARFCARDLCRIFREYTLKKLEGIKVKMEGIGGLPAQTVNDRVREIEGHIRCILPPKNSDDSAWDAISIHQTTQGNDAEGHWGAIQERCRIILFAETLEHAGEHCSEFCP